MKEEIVKDITLWNSKFLHEFPDLNIITRDYYRSNGKYKDTQINKYFGSFKNAVKEIFNKDELDSITYKKKLHSLEEENKNLTKENQKLIKSEVIEDELLAMYKESLNRDLDVKINNEKIVIKDEKNRIAFLQLSDWHIGETVLSQFVNNVNEYNEKICIERLDTTFNVFIAYCKKFNITRCHILLNGDMTSGGIHLELMRNMWCNEVEQVFFIQKYMIKKLEYLTEHFNEINVSVIVGNHSRILQGKPYHKEKVQMNYEYIFGRNLQMYFQLLTDQKRNNKVFIDVPESSFKIININGTRFLATHGDILTGAGTGGFAGIPFYSICSSASRLYGVLHQINVNKEIQFDHLVCGHLHTSTKIPLFNGGFCWIGGCGIGTNEYSLTKIKSVAKKEQLMLIIDSIGRIELEKNITFN